MNYNKGQEPYYLYNSRNKNYDNIHFAQQQFTINQENGYIELFVFTERGRVPVEGALVTVYARRGPSDAIPIRTLRTESYPLTIELPVAHPVGALIRGPEYYFSTYNITIQAVGFSPVRILNIRIFPGITENIDVNLYEVSSGVFPIPEIIIDIPPHPRDSVQD